MRTGEYVSDERFIKTGYDRQGTTALARHAGSKRGQLF